MRWFKQKYSVCSECGVHFEPVTGYEARWGTLCATHRKPIMERDQQKDAVMTWADSNWKRLYKIMEAETANERQAYNQLMQSYLANMAAQQSNNYYGHQYGGLMGAAK